MSEADARSYSEIEPLDVHLETASVEDQHLHSKLSEKWVFDLVYRVVKRLFDIVISAAVLAVVWPVIFYIDWYIQRVSSPPSIFRQTRVKKNRRTSESRNLQRNGIEVSQSNSSHYLCPKEERWKPEKRNRDIGGQPFRFCKFRTMYKDARKCFPHLYRYGYSTDELKTLKFKLENDPRVPGWAKWLRETSLDELPNFINVLKGDLSLVGPRPDIPEMTVYYGDDYKMKLDVKPGVTGLAQIYGRGDLSFFETLKWDVEYVKKRSLLFDLLIIAKTVWITLNGNGAY